MTHDLGIKRFSYRKIINFSDHPWQILQVFYRRIRHDNYVFYRFTKNRFIYNDSSYYKYIV